MDERKMTLIFSSDLKFLDLCKSTYENFLEMKNIKEEDFIYWSWVGIHEALVNAIKHGNKLNPDLQVTFSILFSGDEMIATVADKGPGFETNAVKDPTAPENLLKSSGRGLLFINNIMDSVSFKKEKNFFEITMKKGIGGNQT